MFVKRELTDLEFALGNRSLLSTYNKHVIEEEDSSWVSFFFLARIPYIVQRGQHSELSVKGS